MGISSIFLVQIITLIIIWKKHKKPPTKILALIGINVLVSLLLELIPNINAVRSCKCNYFIEVIAVFDNIFNTKILSLFNIDKIEGADGWDRMELLKTSLKQITSSPKTFIFGAGAGKYLQITPHNPILSLFIDFGVVAPILYLSIITLAIIKVVKTKFNLSNFYLSMSLLCYLICSFAGSINYQHYYIFLIFASELFTSLDDIENENLLNYQNIKEKDYIEKERP